MEIKSREIKIRYYFKDKENKIHTLTKPIEDIEHQDDISWNIKLGWELIARCECVGTIDKNKIEIYEKDILKTNEAGWVGAVYFHDGRFYLEDSAGGFSYRPDWELCEVIGNV